MDDIPDKECLLNLSAASVRSDALSRDDGYFSRTGESLLEEQETQPAQPENLSQDKDKTDDTSKEKLSLPAQNFSLNDIKLWDDISKTVESFSQNTMSYLSWLDELDEITNNDEVKSMFFASHSSRKEAILRQIDRIFTEVAKDATTLVKSVPSEKHTVATVLMRLEDRGRELGVNLSLQNLPVFSEATDHVEETSLKTQSKIPDNLRVKLKILPPICKDKKETLIIEPLTLDRSLADKETETDKEKELKTESKIADKKKSPTTATVRKPLLEEDYMPPLSNNGSAITRRSVSLRANWREFLAEYKAIREWLERMTSVIDWAEQRDLPSSYLEKVFKNYFCQFLRANPKRECLNIKANYIGTMFPEIREQTDEKMDKIDEIWRGLMLRLSYFLIPPTPEEEQNAQETDTDEKSNRSSGSSAEQESTQEDQMAEQESVQLSDFSFHQIRDRLSFDERKIQPEMRLFNKGKHLSAESPRSSPNSTPYRSKAPSVVSNRSTEKLSNSTDSVSGSGGVVELTDRLESFQNWLCGAEEDAYKKENCVAIGWDSQRLHKLLECNKNLRERLEEERAAVDALATMCRKIRLETIEEIELLWSTMMSQQRYNTLLLFTTDMECILERRIDVLTRGSTWGDHSSALGGGI